MAMSVVYTTVNGQILCESRGGVIHHFVSDPLGSVVMVRDNSGNTVYEAEYDPYGNVQSETGTNPSEFGYVGTLGYVKDSAFSLYVRARYLLTNLGRWQTKDRLWPSEPGFVYAGAVPVSSSDPSGLDVTAVADEWWGNYCGAKLGILPAAIGDDLVYVNPSKGERCVAIGRMEDWPAPFDCLDNACIAHDLCLAPFKDIWAYEARHCHCNAMAAALLCKLKQGGVAHPKHDIFIGLFAFLCMRSAFIIGDGGQIRPDIDPCASCKRKARESCRRKYRKDWNKYTDCIRDYNSRYCRHITGCSGGIQA